MADARPRLTAGRSAALWLFERLTQLLWPLPALLGYHILSVYYF